MKVNRTMLISFTLLNLLTLNILVPGLQTSSTPCIVKAASVHSPYHHHYKSNKDDDSAFDPPSKFAVKYGLVQEEEEEAVESVGFFSRLVPQLHPKDPISDSHYVLSSLFSSELRRKEAALDIVTSSPVAKKFVVRPFSEIIQRNETSKVLASAWYNASLSLIGWDYLYVQGDKKLLSRNSTQPEAFYFAGMIEGYLTCRTLDLVQSSTTPDSNFSTSYKEKVPIQKIFYNRGGRDGERRPANAIAWVLQHIEYMKERGIKYNASSAYWRQVASRMAQVQGIADGANLEKNRPLNFSFFDIFALNLDMEWEAIEAATSKEEEFETSEEHDETSSFAEKHHEKIGSKIVERQKDSRFSSAKKSAPFASHCSALIKYTTTNLFASQATWAPYAIMYRFFKTYDFRPAVAAMVRFSSYPAFISSTDDWYKTSTELVVQETTNGNFNNTLYKLYTKPNSVSEFIRAASATAMATSGKEWATLYARENSGTYNDQWMVVDMKLFSPCKRKASLSLRSNSLVSVNRFVQKEKGIVSSQFWSPKEKEAKKEKNSERNRADECMPLRPNTLWILEQIPGNVQSADLTPTLEKQTYWASYNIPYFPEIYTSSGFERLLNAYGDFYSYMNSSRPRIFNRLQKNIIDLPSMQLVMRYNDFQNDPFSLIPNCSSCPQKKCSPRYSAMLSIASRGDLDPPGGCYGPLSDLVGHSVGNFGAIDAKIATFEDRKTMAAYAVSGPTNVQQPTFVFEKPPALHGFPKVWNFSWAKFV